MKQLTGKFALMIYIGLIFPVCCLASTDSSTAKEKPVEHNLPDGLYAELQTTMGNIIIRI